MVNVKVNFFSPNGLHLPLLVQSPQVSEDFVCDYVVMIYIPNHLCVCVLYSKLPG